MRKPIDWNRHVPLGMDGEKTKNWLSLLVGVGGCCSMTFLVDYLYCRNELFVTIRGKRYLNPEAKMAAFETLMEGVFHPMAVVAAGMALIAVLMYFYHYQESRSIYTMKRLPNRWELWRRCLTLPTAFLLLCGVVTAVLTLLYWLIWRFCTPIRCLPL